MTPNSAFTGPCRLRVSLGGEFLAQNGQSRMELICSNVRPTHPALTGKRRAAVQHAMVVNRCMSESAVPFHYPVRRRDRSPTKKKGGGRGKTVIPTAVPGESCTQYSESWDVMSSFHVRIASYSRVTSEYGTPRRALLSSLFHRTAFRLPAVSCSSNGWVAR